MKLKLGVLAGLALLAGCTSVPPQASPPAHVTPTQLSPVTGPYSVLGDADYPAALVRPLPPLQVAVSAEPQATTDQPTNNALPGTNEVAANGATLDIWNRIRGGFSLPDIDNARVEREFAWYADHQEYMNRVVERATPYMHYIVDQLNANHMPTEIALLPIVESAFQPFAYSHGRAAGIWQFIPSTGRRYGLKQDWWYDGRRDVVASTQAAIKLLSALRDEFNGDWMLALAAYNSGGGVVERAIRKNERKHLPTDFFSLDLPHETRVYVPKLLALKKLVNNPDTYNFQLARIDDTPYFERVKLDSQIDLALAADLADMNLDDLYELNPGYNRWATSPDGPNYLLIPLDNAETFKQHLAEYPADKRIKWVRHTIHHGETISTIATNYHTSIDVIKRINHMHGNMLRAGHDLMIPVASQQLSSYTLSASQRQRSAQNTPRTGNKITHVVRSGDTLWNLAQQHRVGVRQLAKWNGMAPRDPLVPGQTLVIWTRKVSATTRLDSLELNAPPKREITQRIEYRVRRGDSLALISHRFNVTVEQLLHWNRKLARSNYLQPGQQLTLYVDITRTSSRS